jgi:predicted acylesterase/phospholipase RssA
MLLIGTTNLLAQRPVFWDMGRIAQIGTPEALDLFRQVLLASTAIPGLFPPVQIAVTAEGRTYYEMHVDGGTTREVFLSPTALSFRSIDAMIGRRVQRHLWIIRNGKIGPEYAYVDDTAMAIAARSLSTLTKNQGIGDLIRMYVKARAEGIDYNLVAMPEDFSHPRTAPFDKDYMKALFERGNAVGSHTE